MRGHRSPWLLTGLLVGVVALPGMTRAQSSTAPTSTVPASPAPTRKPVKHRKRSTTNHSQRTASSSGVTTIPLETAPPTPSTAASRAQTRQQRSADQRLLSQQQAQSDKAAQVNDQTAQRAQQQQDQVQGETRIQDAPGPSQTGVLPGGSPGSSSSPSTGIQDAPGPAQTLPQPAQTPSPSQSTQPASPPQS